MTHQDNLNQAILGIASKKASTDSSQSRHLAKMGTRYSGRGSAHYQYTFPNEQNQLTVPGYVEVNPAANLISQYLAKLIKPKKKIELDKDLDKADSSSDTYNKSRQIVSNLDIENYKLLLALSGGALNQAEFDHARKFNRIDAAKKSKELEVPSIETANESTTESHMNNILKNKIKNQCYKVLSEKFYDMFLESPQSGGPFAPGFPSDKKRGPNATGQPASQKEQDKKETEAEEERKKGKPVPGVDPVEPAGGGGGGTPSKEPLFPPLTPEVLAPEVPAPRVPDSVVPAPTGGGTVGGGEVVLPSGEKVKLRDDNYGPEAPPLAGEPLAPGQTDFTVARPRSAWSGPLYNFAYGPGESEALATAAGVAQNLATRPGPDVVVVSKKGKVTQSPGPRRWAVGPNAGKVPGAAGYIAPGVALTGTLMRTWDTVTQNMSDPGDMIGEIGDLWLHGAMDYFGYNVGKGFGGAVKHLKPRKSQFYPGDETAMSVAQRDVARIHGRPLPAKVYQAGTERASVPISHEQMIQAGAAFARDGKYNVPVKTVVTPGSPFPGGAAPSVAQVPVFQPVPNYTGFSPIKGLSDNWKKIAAGAGLGTVAAVTTAAKFGVTKPTGGQSQDDETRETKNATAARRDLIGIEANDWYARWIANRDTFGKVGVSPIGGQGLDVRFMPPIQQGLKTREPDGKFEVR